MEKPFICLQTDFGLYWGAVSSMHGVIASIDPALRVEDISHLLPIYQPWAASFCLNYTMPCWPEGTIFVSVVDPGVGTSRRACAAKTAAGQFVITPDNGTLTHIKAFPGIREVREIDEGVNRRPGTARYNTFHGRDIFAYTAGRLAAGIIGFEEVGPAYPVEEIESFPLVPPEFGKGYASGHISMADHHFGGATTNIPIEGFEGTGFVHGDKPLVTITHQGREVFRERVLYHRSFGFVGLGEPILYNGSTGYILIGLNQGNFSDQYAIEAGLDWKVVLSI
ncbi:MAG: SAM-dependent chlorinase/fluorinase [Spirochaetaceae bacterium]|jgi:S-adenosylmethionine hydrolase|nr:SAM-dependent chlorinase/fluorinase [Spirochaetaceae bacterium]